MSQGVGKLSCRIAQVLLYNVQVTRLLSATQTDRLLSPTLTEHLLSLIEFP